MTRPVWGWYAAKALRVLPGRAVLPLVDARPGRAKLASSASRAYAGVSLRDEKPQPVGRSRRRFMIVEDDG